MTRRETTPLEDLYSMLSNRMMTAMQIIPAADFIDLIYDIETEHGIEFTTADILRQWRSAAEYVVDAYIDNAQTTSSFTPEEREREITNWESQRPSITRRAALAAALKSE